MISKRVVILEYLVQKMAHLKLADFSITHLQVFSITHLQAGIEVLTHVLGRSLFAGKRKDEETWSSRMVPLIMASSRSCILFHLATERCKIRFSVTGWGFRLHHKVFGHRIRFSVTGPARAAASSSTLRHRQRQRGLVFEAHRFLYHSA